MAPGLPMFRLRAAVSLTTSIYIIGLLSTSAPVRASILRLFLPTTHPYRFISLLLALILNHKSLPFVWHFRLFGSMIQQLYLQPSPLPEDALFRPLVMKQTYTPLREVDYNLHKSNSTYFADFDIGRTQLVTCLLRKGIRAAGIRGSGDNDSRLQPGGDAPSVKEGNFMIALGGVSCNFKKEVKPYEPYEIWTRVLSWDNKWVYLVSHMVKAGRVKPDGWALQPWKRRQSKGERSGKVANGNISGLEAEKDKQWKDAILASSISKYVVKKGRWTIPPELVLRRSDLLPPRPSSDITDASAATELNAEQSQWNWTNVERERLRGMQLAEKFAAMEGVVEEFPRSRFPYHDQGLQVLGQYTDLSF